MQLSSQVTLAGSDLAEGHLLGELMPLGGPWACVHTQTPTNSRRGACFHTPAPPGLLPMPAASKQEWGKPCPDSPSPLPAPAIPVLVQAALQFAHANTTSPMEKELGTRCSQGSFFQAQRAELGSHSKALWFIALIKTFI